MPDEEMIRRVDKAILEYIYARTGTMICNLSVAEVGIAAMRVPTEKMKLDGAMTLPDYDPGIDDAESCYQAMIDAILK